MVRSRGLALLALSCVALSAGPCLAETPEVLFDRGNAAYDRGEFDEAAKSYRAVVRYGISDPRVEYNLANAEFKLGRLGQAILHYERARRLDPTDVDTRENLAYARTFCFDKVEPEPQYAVVRWVSAAQDRVGPDRQAWVLVVLIWCIAGLFAWGFAVPNRWSASHGWTLALLLLLLAGMAGSWAVTDHRLSGERLGVVLDEVVEVLAGPGANNATLSTVHEGLTVEVLNLRQEWAQVVLPNRLRGWMPLDSLGLV